MKKKRLLALLLTAGLTIGLAACGTEQPVAEPEKEPVEFVACMGDEPPVLDPALAGEPGSDTVLLHLFENLMKKDVDLEGVQVLANGMAKEYSKKLNEDDTVTYTFRLRESSHWSDGEPMKAEHFVLAWQRLADPANGYENASLLNMIRGYDQLQETGELSALAVEALDEHTLRVTLSYDCAYFLSDICTHPATLPLRADMLTAGKTLKRELPGNGPYAMVRWEEDTLVTERNTHYYGFRALLVDQLRFRFSDSAEESYALYQQGEADFIRELPAEAVQALSQSEDWAKAPYAAVYAVMLNNSHEAFADELVRRAFLLCVDYVALEEIIGIAAEPATGLVPWGVQDVEATEEFRTVGGDLIDTSAQTYAQRCEEARGLLAQAGYGNGEGFPAVEYCYLTGEPEHTVAQALAAMWQEALHITVTLRNVTQEEQTAAFAEGTYDMAGLRLTSAYDDSMGFLARWRSTHEENLARYANATYDVLMGVTDASQNAAARVAFLHDAEAMLLEDAGVIPLYFYSETHLLAPQWEAVFSDDMGRFRFINVKPVE